MRIWPHAALASVTFFAVSCNIDTAVFVSPSVSSPVLTVTKGALGTSLQGMFALSLHLGARASGPSQVTVGAFSLRSADQKTVYVADLPITMSPMSPVGVAPDSTQTVEVTITTGSTLLPAATHDAICSGQVVLSGIIDDTLANTPTSVTSAAFAPTCM